MTKITAFPAPHRSVPYNEESDYGFEWSHYYIIPYRLHVSDVLKKVH